MTNFSRPHVFPIPQPTLSCTQQRGGRSIPGVNVDQSATLALRSLLMGTGGGMTINPSGSAASNNFCPPTGVPTGPSTTASLPRYAPTRLRGLPSCVDRWFDGYFGVSRNTFIVLTGAQITDGGRRSAVALANPKLPPWNKMSCFCC